MSDHPTLTGKDPDEVHQFATVLVQAGELRTASDVLYFFEKPWKWQELYEFWREYGQLMEGDSGWTDFWNAWEEVSRNEGEPGEAPRAGLAESSTEGVQ